MNQFSWVGATFALVALGCHPSGTASQTPEPVSAAAPDRLPPAATTPVEVPTNTSTDHHHVESCWIEGSNASTPDDVDMMLFVVGLNHRLKECKINCGLVKCADCAVTRTGVDEVAEAIHQAWPGDAKRIVVVSSAFPTSTCPPHAGACLKDALEKKYSGEFDLNVVEEPSGLDLNIVGVISGSRWQASIPEKIVVQKNPVAAVPLVDQETRRTLMVYAMHTAGGDAALKEVAPIAIRAQGVKRAITPIIAGDFNFSADSEDATNVRAFFEKNVTWLNQNVKCVGASGAHLPVEYGNMMHAVAGLIAAPDPKFSYACAPAQLERVRMSYSVDAQGRLAKRQDDSRDARYNGIVLNYVAHNVLAIGLRLKDAPAQPCSRPQPKGAKCGHEDDCGYRCKCDTDLTCDKTKKKCVPCPNEEECNVKCAQKLDSCLAGCEGHAPAGCAKDCQRANATCSANCTCR